MSAALRPVGIALALASALVACAPPAPRDDGAPLVWPPAPAAARIVFVNAFSRPEDLGVKKSLVRRAADLLFGASEARLVRPIAVVAAGGSVYVADPGAKGVHRFDRTAGRYTLVQGEKGAQLGSPVGMALGAEGDVYVSDSAQRRVLVIRRGASFASAVALRAELRQPTGIAADPATGRLFVVDTAAHRVLVFERDGSLRASFGRRGTGDGEFNYPTLIWRDPQGRLYVTDSLNFRVQVLDEHGTLLGKFGRAGDGTGDAARQKGVATDRYGHVYVVDSLFQVFQIFDASGRFLLSVGEPGTEPGQFWLPTGIFIGEDDTIYVADSYNRRVQVFRYVGGPT